MFVIVGIFFPVKTCNPPSPYPSSLEEAKLWRNHTLFVSPVKTGVQSICNILTILDSGFRRNDVK